MTPESDAEIESTTNARATPALWPVWQPPPGLPEPAREVWLAGLGAFSRAQAEGGKAFQALVRQGLTLQTQASQVAQERLAEAAQPWERLSGLNGIFEDRVARALAHMGLPGPRDWAALQARVQALEAALHDALHAAPTRKPTAKPALKPTAKSVTPTPSGARKPPKAPASPARAPSSSARKKRHTPASP